jgi:hypothetical protein
MDFFPVLENFSKSHPNSGKAVFRAVPKFLYFTISLPPFVGVRGGEEGKEGRREREEKAR